MTRLANPSPLLEAIAVYNRQFDFEGALQTEIHTSIGGGSATALDLAAGILQLDPGSTDNGHVFVHSTKKVFKADPDKPCLMHMSAQFTDGNSGAANVCFGFVDAPAVTILGNDGAGPPADFTGALLYKLDGETVWRTITSVGTTQQKDLSVNAAGGSDYHTYSVYLQPVESGRVDENGLPASGSNCEVVFNIDGNPLRNSSGNIIKHTLAYTPAVMSSFFGVKNGSANQELLNVDYQYVQQVR